MAPEDESPTENAPLKTAREAFAEGDIEASRAAHAAGHSAGEHHTGEEATYAKSIIFGALDGMLTGFAVIAAVSGGGLGWQAVPTVGIATVLAGAISMGVGEYLGSIAETERATEEHRREKWELTSNPEGEKLEMVEIFEKKGMSGPDAKLVIDTLAKYEDLFLSIMMTHELGLETPEPDAHEDSLKQAVAMFGSFFVFGVVPLLPYIYALFVPGTTNMLPASIGLTGLELFAMGAFKSTLGNRHWGISGLESLVLGALAAAAAFAAASVV